HRSGAEEAAGRIGGKARPLWPQERQGLLRLSREGQGPEEPVAGPRRTPAEASRPRYARCRGVETALPGGAGGGSRADRGRSRHRRSARGRCRLDPRLRLCAVHRRHAVLYRLHGNEEVRRAVPQVGGQIRLALHAAKASGRDGGKGRDVLRPLPAEEGRSAGCGVTLYLPLKRGGRFDRRSEREGINYLTMTPTPTLPLSGGGRRQWAPYAALTRPSLTSACCTFGRAATRSL